MADKLKVTFTTINVTDNGEPAHKGRGEIYWDLLVDGQLVSNRSVSNPRKTADGETISVNQHRTVTKETGQLLLIEGSVKEKDDIDKDEFASFKDEYTKAMNWGIGTHTTHALVDGKLDVTVTYKIERQ
jgi:hypothetical protein